MSEKYFLLTTKHIVKAPNMTQAKLAVEGESDFVGEVLKQNVDVNEVSNAEAIKYVGLTDSVKSDFVYDDSLDFSDEDGAESFSNKFDLLRSENRRLAKAVDKYKNVKDEAVLAVYQAAYDAFSSYEMPQIKSPNIKSSKTGTPETAVAVFADWQLGKVTPTYNSDVLSNRIELYTEKLLEIAEIQRADHPVDNLHVWLLGDIVEGEEIFPGQSHLIDSGLYRQVGVNGPEILSTFLKTALENFKHVHVTGVIGNHGAVGGRARKQHDPETNMDRLLYKIVELIFKDEPRITFNIPDGKGERNFYAVDNIGNYSSLLIHGDQMPAPTSYYGYYKKVMGWKDGAIPENFDDVFMGHYHQQFKMTIGSGLLRISGSPESHNTYAQEYFSSMSRPCQHLMFVHPENGITSEYSIWLD
jgi:hypothetical protein